MKKRYMKITAMVLCLMMVLAMFSACGSKQSDSVEMEAMVDAAVKAALEATANPGEVIIEADGRQITIEETEGKSIRQLVEMAGVILNEGDVLSLAADQTLTGNITIQVLRKCMVSVVDSTLDTQNPVRYTVVLLGGTVADAIEAVGVELAENHIASHALEDALVDGMEIIISAKEEPTEPEEESDEDFSADSNTDSGSNSGSNSGSGDSGNSGSDDSGNSGDSGSSDDSGTEGGRYVVDVVYYYDCDDSGHGVKVITYSDGTQEEVYF